MRLNGFRRLFYQSLFGEWDKANNYINQMFGLNLSSNSNSESQDENLDGHFKKVAYNGKFSDSEREESQIEESNSQQSKKASKDVGKITNNKSSDPCEKSKTIKKNCQSAKMSRQRKKVYLQLLEQKAQQLKTEIASRKNNIRDMSHKILQKFNRSNKEKKHIFLTKKLALSKKLIGLTEEIKQLKKAYQEYCTEKTNQMMPLEMQQNKTPDSSYPNGNEKEQMKAKSRKRKAQVNKNLNSKKEFQTKIAQKYECLQLAINAYMYEFGVKGCLRGDVVERAKCEWLGNIQLSSELNPELTENLNKMQKLLHKLQQRGKRLDYNLRELRDRIKEKYVVQFLLDREFFIHNSSDTIYKHSQIGNSQPPNA